MEITLLIQAADDAYKILEKARKQAIDLLYSTVTITSETRGVQERKFEAVLRGTETSRADVRKILGAFVILFPFWLLFSGKFDSFHITLGVICTLIVSCLSHDLFFANVRAGDMRTILQRFLLYMPWHFYQILISNFYVAKLVLSPKMPIDPQIIKFKTKLESDISMMTLATSITLTPGTITMDIKDGEFIVHALDKKVAADLHTGEMEDRVAHVFMEADHIYIQDVLDMARLFDELK